MKIFTKKISGLFFLAILFSLTSFLSAQNEGKKWYFGQNAGLDFTTVPPTILTNGQLTTFEGCSSIADFAGNLLFYTDGITVWDASHAVMANGTGLFGDGSSTQAGVIVKKPGSTTLYYIFTVDDFAGPNGLCYSIVDMSLAAGMGSVTTKNVLMQTPSTEKITGVKHCNGHDIWIVSHDYNSTNFRTFLLTSAGLNATPVISAVGSNHNGGTGVVVGALKTSPNGKKVGLCISNNLNTIEVYDFDNSTGSVSNPIILGTISGIYGCEFSPDGTKFYGAAWYGSAIYQWDLCAGSSTAIIASQYTASASEGGQLQLAPDGKIYMARTGQSDLGVINNPNASGSGCNYVNSGQSIAPKTNGYGLPNFITSFLSTPFTYTMACGNASFTAPPSLPATTGGACSASNNTYSAVSWNFGDPSTASSNTSTALSPAHQFSAPGTYTVLLVRTSVCGNDTIALPIIVPPSAVSLNAAPTVTQANCTSTTNAFNLGLTFSPSTPAPSYTITWSSIPNGVTNNTMTSASGSIAAGIYTAVISTGGGCFSSATFTINPPIQTLNFSVTPASLLTCNQPSVTLNVDPINTYTWVSLSSGPFTGASQSFDFNQTGNWTITAMNAAGCVGTKTFAISLNTITPTSIITPVFQNITCTLSSIQTITATANPSINVLQEITSPQNVVFSSPSYTTVYVPGGTGTFTHCAINQINGCKSCKNFTVASNQGFPNFNVISPQNFTLGCNSTSFAIVNIVNGNTTPPGGAVSYTILPPGASSATPSGTLSSAATYTVNAPGTYTVITKDNTSYCETRTPMSILANTVAPTLTATASQALSCNTPSIVLEGFSETPNVNYGWSFPPVGGSPGNVQGYSLTVNINSVAPTTTLVANYTLTITDNSSSCKSTSVVPILQNIFPPKPLITNGGTSSITCNTSTIVLTNQSSTGIPPNSFPTNSIVVAYIWDGPSPQQPGQFTTTYLAATVGVYTLTVKDYNNGCTSSTTIPIYDNRLYPTIDPPLNKFYLDCGATVTSVTLDLGNPPSKPYAYLWTSPPTASITQPNSATLTTKNIGDYSVLVTNTVNGCATKAYYIVYSGSLTASFTANDTTGYAPLSVTFENTSQSVLGNAGMTSAWNFGNSTGTLTTAYNASATYNQPGTYTVTLFSTKGICIDTAYKVIHVEIPSSLEIPNVFTPNGDNANDLFFVKGSNLTEIDITIVDRWGQQVYQLKSKTGNIAWDGKTPKGKDAAEGVYMYVLRAKGSDGQNYKKEGTISLFR
ncbi:hypothetical protein CNR22_07425 [Sphingobacteriaceae bacterium]|nr:hypothetical protein CNR22_07425 [Sphingobacteriaceae bacterium]